MKPHILVVGRKGRVEYYQPYLEAVGGAGGRSVLALPMGETARDESALMEFLRPFQGILLPGGVDVEPWRYDEKPHEKVEPSDAELDEGQLAVARFVLREGLPTLAVCRGLQVMGVAVGATLYQDIPSQRPSEVDHNIREPKDYLAHEVIVKNGSLLASLSGSLQFRVNSRHHQAVRENGDSGCIGPFHIVARAPDGIVEGMEIASHRFLVAVQWHPENLYLAGDHYAQGLFRGFIEACRSIDIDK